MLKLIKKLFRTLMFIYKNIFHFIFSKLLIVLSSSLMWILFSIPFLLLAILIIYFSPLTLSNFITWWGNLVQDFLLHKWWFILVLIIWIIGLIVFISTYNYRRILFAKLNLNYINWKKLSIKKNDYFNFKLIFKNIKIHFFMFWILIFNLFIYLILLLILVYIYWWILNIESLMNINLINSFSISSLILTLFFILINIYLIYRIYFSLYIILEDKKITAIKAIKKSFKQTKSFLKLVKLLLILVFLFILYIPFNYIEQYSDYKINKILDYVEIKNKILFNKKLNDREKIDYSFLNKEFSKYSKEKFISEYNKYYYMRIIYIIFYFIFILWIFDLFMILFYRNEIKK